MTFWIGCMLLLAAIVCFAAHADGLGRELTHLRQAISEAPVHRCPAAISDPGSDRYQCMLANGHDGFHQVYRDGRLFAEWATAQ